MGFFADIQAVAKEDEVQLGKLGLAGETHVVVQIYGGVYNGAWVPPRRHVAAGPGKERT